MSFANGLKPPDEFRTKRLVVRRVTLDDVDPLFHAFGGSAEATRFLTWRPSRSPSEYRQFIEGVALRQWEDKTGFHWVLEPHGGAPVGMVSLDAGEHGVELGYVLSPEEWGKGLMAEGASAPVSWALGEQDVHRVWATCDCENTASVRVLEKLDFALEGTLRRWALHPNVSAVPRDSYCYSRVK